MGVSNDSAEKWTFTAETSCPVACLEVLDGEGLVAARGTAVNDDEVDAAHRFNS